MILEVLGGSIIYESLFFQTFFYEFCLRKFSTKILYSPPLSQESFKNWPANSFLPRFSLSITGFQLPPKINSPFTCIKIIVTLWRGFHNLLNEKYKRSAINLYEYSYCYNITNIILLQTRNTASRTITTIFQTKISQWCNAFHVSWMV